jgi:LPS O-antigen subunit length determinant protein (WzzB/FepE family)
VNKKYYSNDDEIDLRDLFLLVWRQKILVLFFIILGSILFVIYAKSSTENFKYKVAHITLKAPSISDPDLGSFAVKFDNVNQQLGFFYEFKRNLLSNDNFAFFIENRKDKDLDKLKENLIKKNLTLRKYLDNQILIGEVEINGKVVLNKFFIRYPKVLNGENILTDYVLFVKDQIIKDFNNSKQLELLSLIEKTQQSLSIAEKLGIIFPTNNINPTININNDSNLIKSDFEYYKGTVVLTEQLAYLNATLKNANLRKINYNPILDKAKSVANEYDEEVTIFNNALLGMLAGFLLSFVVLFIRFSLIKK